MTAGWERPSWKPKCSWPDSAPGLTAPSTMVKFLTVPAKMDSICKKRSRIVALHSPVMRKQPWIIFCLKTGSHAGSVFPPVTTPGSERPLLAKLFEASASCPAEKIVSCKLSVIPLIPSYGSGYKGTAFKVWKPEVSHSIQTCLRKGNVGTDDLEERFITLRLVILNGCCVGECLCGSSNQRDDIP